MWRCLKAAIKVWAIGRLWLGLRQLSGKNWASLNKYHTKFQMRSFTGISHQKRLKAIWARSKRCYVEKVRFQWQQQSELVTGVASFCYPELWPLDSAEEDCALLTRWSKCVFWRIRGVQEIVRSVSKCEWEFLWRVWWVAEEGFVRGAGHPWLVRDVVMEAGGCEMAYA